MPTGERRRRSARHGLGRGVLIVVLAAAATALQATEERITFEVEGQTVVGTLNLPDTARAPPAVLLLHGFTGSRDELEIPAAGEGIYARAARLWAQQGIASLRIDFRFNGDSHGAFADATLDAHLADALAALDWLAACGRVDAERLALVGWSMGGAVAASAAARSPQALGAVALWAPAVNLAATLYSLLGAETVNQGLADPEASVTGTLPWGAEITLKGAFFESLFRYDPVADITRYHGPLFVAVGLEDEAVFPQPTSGQLLIDYHRGAESRLFVRPMDHAFDALEGVTEVDELIAATGRFLARHLTH